MSAQGGIFYFDERPIDADVPERLLGSLSAYGPDDHGAFVTAGLAMVSQLMYVTHHDESETQPYMSQRRNVITWDGRLDNRDELLMLLWDEIAGDPPDSELALRVYERLGLSGLRRLIGDWSLVIWDHASGSLVLGSDYMGTRGLYYRAYPDRLEWSSSLGALIDRLDCGDELDPTYIAGALTNGIPPHLTPYRRVYSVPPGKVLRCTQHGRLTIETFWSWQTSTIVYKDHRDYVAEFTARFAHAVLSRMQTDRTVYCQLSGGLDSSAVVCMADLLMRRGASRARGLKTVSYIPAATSPESSELRFIAEVERHTGRDGHHVTLNDDERGRERESWITPIQSDVRLALLQTVRNLGGRLLLTGHLGDEVCGNYLRCHDTVAAELAAGKFVLALRIAHRWAGASRMPIWSVLGEALLCCAPARFQARRHLRSKLNELRLFKGTLEQVAEQAFLLEPRWARWWCDEQIQQVQLALANELSQRTLGEIFVRVSFRRSLQTDTEIPDLLTVHPFGDRRLVEWVRAIPPEVLYAPGAPRALMREACAPFLPQRISGRFSKGYAAPSLTRRTRSVVATLGQSYESFEVVRRGFINPQRLAQSLRTLQGGATAYPFELPTLVMVEQWLRARTPLQSAA